MGKIFRTSSVMGTTRINVHGKDYGYHYKFMKRCVKYFNINSISYIPNIIGLMRSCGLKNKDIQNIFCSFVSNYNLNQIDQIDWWNERSFIQINFNLKNYVAARISYQYRDQFFGFLQNYNCPNLKSKSEFDQKMSEINESLKNQQQQQHIIANMNLIEYDDDINDFLGNDAEFYFNFNSNDDDIDQFFC